MLKFSGYSYLIRGQLLVRRVSAWGCFTAWPRPAPRPRGLCYYAEVAAAWPPLHFGGGGGGSGVSHSGAVPQRQSPLGGTEGRNDARTGMPARILAGAMCVQRFDDSLNSAIHITYRISLRSSSMPEPRDPLLKVLIHFHPALARKKVHSEENDAGDAREFGGSCGGRRVIRTPWRGRRGAIPPRQRLGRGSHWGLGVVNSVMIPPLVHQRRPCYDFYFL